MRTPSASKFWASTSCWTKNSSLTFSRSTMLRVLRPIVLLTKRSKAKSFTIHSTCLASVRSARRITKPSSRWKWTSADSRRKRRIYSLSKENCCEESSTIFEISTSFEIRVCMKWFIPFLMRSPLIPSRKTWSHIKLFRLLHCKTSASETMWRCPWPSNSWNWRKERRRKQSSRRAVPLHREEQRHPGRQATSQFHAAVAWPRCRSITRIMSNPKYLRTTRTSRRCRDRCH